LRGVLAEVGIADACIAREMPDGSLMLLDGHLRTETLGGELVPVLVLDVNEEEADKILATLDPLAAMADMNTAKLNDLINSLDITSEGMQSIIDSLILPGEFTEQDFEPGTIDEQGQLDKLDPKLVTCPNCKMEFDCRGQV
jgi:hypothetical protein